MIKRSKHNLSNTAITTFDPGEFIPFNVIEIEPGASIQAKTESVLRCLPLLAPLMHEVEVMITHTFTPHRLIWDDFEDFITGGDDGLNASTFPTIDFSGSPVAVGDLANYLGLPVGFNGSASALPFRAYAKFYNDHLIDEELQTELVIDTTSGADTTTSTTLKNVNWAGSRFTKSQADEQLGTAINLPLGTRAPLLGLGTIENDFSTSQGTAYMGGATSKTFTSGEPAVVAEEDPNNSGYPNFYADLSNATGATINELREAIALQKFMEMRQIYGSTYEKLLQADFNISPQDHRLNNSEILARGRGFVKFSEVLATAETGTTVDVGDMKGHGIAAVRSNKFRKFFPEYGYLISYVAIRPKESYTQGVPKHYLKSTKEDFFNPLLQNMGNQQVIQNREVKYDHSTPGGTFSYEPIYNEYRSQPNTYSGDFDSTLNYWHMGRDLSGDPALNSSFITCSPTNRVFAQSTTDNILGMFRNVVAKRSLVKKSLKPVGLI
jgi:hypothetical protein